MANKFNPYEKWLEIPLHDQPANHYRMLGLTTYESDATLISQAAEQQMTLLRTFQTGKHSEWSQKLLNEVAEAKICLLDQTKKTRYDHRLKKHLAQKVQRADSKPAAKPSRPNVDELLPPSAPSVATPDPVPTPEMPQVAQPVAKTPQTPPESPQPTNLVDNVPSIAPPKIQTRPRRKAKKNGLLLTVGIVFGLIAGVCILAGVVYLTTTLF